jgi:predicted nucleic acid-binding protein
VTAVTAIKVVDASAIVALLFGEAKGPEIADQLRGCRLLAPNLLSIELANVCLMKARRLPNERDTLLAAFRLRGHIAIEEMPVDHDAVLDLALTTGLTAYDASYLWLARVFRAELVTLDRQLATAAATP